MSKDKRTRYIARRWRIRILVSMIMLMMAFIGLLIMDLHPRSYWLYSRVMAVSYAFLSIGMFWYLHRGEHKLNSSTIWHQLLHWTGLILTIYLVDVFVNTGLMGTVQAGLVTLTLLALATFLSGVYSNPSFMVIGLLLGALAGGAAMVQAYLSVLMIPVILVTGTVIYLLSHHEKRKAHRENS